MKAMIRSLLAAGLLCGAVASAQDSTNRLLKPQQRFFFYQVNLAGGYDSREPENGWGLADRGPRSQVSVEWFGKNEERIQKGYSRLASPSNWNVKLALEVDPAERDGEDPDFHLRLVNVSLRFDTRWDRTSVTVGHLSIPFGHNPKLDPDLTFLPNQAPLDLGFGSDTGVFFATPVSGRLDLEVSATAGGFLSGNPYSLMNLNGDYEGVDRLDYRDTWLATARLGTPTFRADDVGVFAAAGKLHRDTGALTSVSRLGVEWVRKSREDWKMVHQVSAGENERPDLDPWTVANVLNSVEVFPMGRLRLGLTNAWRWEDREDLPVRPETGTLFGMISWALNRDSRLRLNPFYEWRDRTGERESGVLLQVCTGCGLKK